MKPRKGYCTRIAPLQNYRTLGLSPISAATSNYSGSQVVKAIYRATCFYISGISGTKSYLNVVVPLPELI